jgi:hypothetical protein
MLLKLIAVWKGHRRLVAIPDLLAFAEISAIDVTSLMCKKERMKAENCKTYKEPRPNEALPVFYHR